MMRWWIAVSLSGLLALPSLAAAQVTPDVLNSSGDYMRQYLAADVRNRQLLDLYLHAMAQGMEWGSIASKASGGPELFCLPKTYAVSPQQVSAILLQYVKAVPEAQSDALGGTLMFALQDAFPCADGPSAKPATMAKP